MATKLLSQNYFKQSNVRPTGAFTPLCVSYVLSWNTDTVQNFKQPQYDSF